MLVEGRQGIIPASAGKIDELTRKQSSLRDALKLAESGGKDYVEQAKVLRGAIAGIGEQIEQRGLQTLRREQSLEAPALGRDVWTIAQIVRVQQALRVDDSARDRPVVDGRRGQRQRPRLAGMVDDRRAAVHIENLPRPRDARERDRLRLDLVAPIRDLRRPLGLSSGKRHRYGGGECCDQHRDDQRKAALRVRRGAPHCNAIQRSMREPSPSSSSWPG